MTIAVGEIGQKLFQVPVLDGKNLTFELHDKPRS